MPLSPQAEAIVDALGQHPGITPAHLHYLRSAIHASPALMQQFNDAVAQQRLHGIAPLHDANAGAIYHRFSGEIRIAPKALDSPAPSHTRRNEIIFVLGHELQHALNRDYQNDVNERFVRDIEAVATSAAFEHDYSDSIDRGIAAERTEEASAEIAGWNALVSATWNDAATSLRQAPTLEGIYNSEPSRMADFIDVDRSGTVPVYSLKPNLELGARLYMPASQKNLLGMGQNYFDTSHGLGHHGNSDYANFYGASYIGRALRCEHFHHSPLEETRAHQVRLDVARLGLSPRLLAENGIDLTYDNEPVPYVDRSVMPPIHARFWHTAQDHIYPPVGPCLDHAMHPGHALYRQALLATGRLHLQYGGKPDQRCYRLAAALAASAASDGMHDIHQAVLSEDGKRVFAVQGDLHSPFRRTTSIEIAQAVITSVEHSSLNWRQAMEHRAAPQPTAGKPANAPIRPDVHTHAK